MHKEFHTLTSKLPEQFILFVSISQKDIVYFNFNEVRNHAIRTLRISPPGFCSKVSPNVCGGIL